MKTPFEPPTLPLEKLAWDNFIELIGEAGRSLGEFRGLLQSIPNVDIFLSPLTTNEAVLSSRIEGTQATLEEVLSFKRDPRQDTRKYNDIIEIINYRKAMENATTKLKRFPLAGRLIKEIHASLLKDARGAGKNPGNFRTGEVFVGIKGLDKKHARYIPPQANMIAKYFSNLEKYIHIKEKDGLVQLAIIHAQFELLHPFWDGNGRTGRIIIPLFLYYKKILSEPMFYLSEYLEAHREEYYVRLENISTRHDWEGWISFFLTAVREQAKDNIKTIRAMLTLYATLKEEISEMPTPKYSIKVLDFLFSFPKFNADRLMKKIDIGNPPTAYRVITFLVAKKIVTKDDNKKNRTYSFDRLLELITR